MQGLAPLTERNGGWPQPQGGDASAVARLNFTIAVSSRTPYALRMQRVRETELVSCVHQ